jgi:outer membrane receptor protein involved in Fe transport
VVATTPAGPLAQATNYADVRIAGIEYSLDAPILVGRGVLTLSSSGAFTRGTITDGLNPLISADLDGTPADNITPSKIMAAARFTEPAGRWWVEYGDPGTGRGDARRPHAARFAVPDRPGPAVARRLRRAARSAGASTCRANRERLGLTFAVENLTNKYYREHFQFAPARGRSFTVGLNVGAF